MQVPCLEVDSTDGPNFSRNAKKWIYRREPKAAGLCEWKSVHVFRGLSLSKLPTHISKICLYACVYVCGGARGGQKRVSDPWSWGYGQV